MRGIPTFPQLRRLREINLNRTYHLLQKPDILICYQHINTLDYVNWRKILISLKTQPGSKKNREIACFGQSDFCGLSCHGRYRTGHLSYLSVHKD